MRHILHQICSCSAFRGRFLENSFGRKRETALDERGYKYGFLLRPGADALNSEVTKLFLFFAADDSPFEQIRSAKIPVDRKTLAATTRDQASINSVGTEFNENS